jgi:hypothetical protein
MKKRFLGLDWKEHLIYAVLLLATGWFFQHKTTEQARLHGIMEAVFPLAAQAISTRQNERLMQHINREADYYRSDRRESYRARAKDIQKWVEISSLELERIAETPDVEFQRKELVHLLEQLSRLPDSILLACDSDSAVGQRLRQIYPDQFWDMAAEYLPRAEQPELARLANALRVRTGLAANVGLRYCFSRVRDHEIRYAHIPVLEARQSCPRVGELFEAEIYLDNYLTDPNFDVEINDRPVVSDNGLVHFEQRFTHSGKHKIKARFVRPLNEEGAKFLYEREFEVEVWPR